MWGAATAGFAFESAEAVVSPVDVLSTGDAGATAVVVVVVFEVESVEAMVLSVLAASWRAQAIAKLRTLPTRTARPSIETGGKRQSS